MNNSGFVREQLVKSANNNSGDDVQTRNNPINTTSDDGAVTSSANNCYSRCARLWKRYHWRMRHYFYIHLWVFFCNTLLCGAIIWRIEDYEVSFIDCWFMSATCVFTCGLQTNSFSSFRLPSQILLLFFTFISGITVSTLPAVVIKIYRAKREINLFEETSPPTIEENTFTFRRRVHQDSPDSILDEQLKSLPYPHHLRVTSYVILIVTILSTCALIYLLSFLAIGFWLKHHYNPNDLLQSNAVVNPFYASLVITLTGFNQNGLSPWSSGASLFVEDVFMNTAIMIVVICGTSLFPAILRSVVSVLKYLSPWKYKIFFDYILLNNHRLSAVIFPSIQTRLYVTVTILMQILGVTVALALDFNNVKLAIYSGGHRFMIFMFHVVNTRFGGYATITITDLSAATLIILVLLMSIKPQMLCTIHETPFEMEWVLLQTQEQIGNYRDRHDSVQIFLPFKRMKHYLLRKGSITKAEAKRYFARTRRVTRAEAAISQLTERHLQRRMSVISAARRYTSLEGFEDNHIKQNIHISLIRIKLLLIIFCRHVILSLFQLLTSTRTWLFIAIFLICTFEAPRVVPGNPIITVFRITFEVISAFGGCGLSMGFSNVTSSLASVLISPSKITLILVMCMGRHRGLLDSMKDQEEIEYSAQTLIDSWRQATIVERKKKIMINTPKQVSPLLFTAIPSTPPVTTRF